MQRSEAIAHWTFLCKPESKNGKQPYKYHKVQTANAFDRENGLVAGYTELIRQAIVSRDLCEVEYVFLRYSSRKNIKDNQGKYSAEELHHLDGVVEVYEEHVHNNRKTGDQWQ